jgi:trehalose 6-phosphate phosphatase
MAGSQTQTIDRVVEPAGSRNPYKPNGTIAVLLRAFEGRFALLLDIDGTLLDIAPTPNEVVVPDGLAKTLTEVSERIGGAVALVSGRPLKEIDEFFPLQMPAIGGHGAEMRPVAGGAIIQHPGTVLDAEFKDRLKVIAAAHPGVLVEDKGYSLALHYRLVPKQGLNLVHHVKRAYEAWGDRSIELLTGKAVIELKFAGFNKGTAVRQLMGYPPFAGRAPVFVGDDHTDEDAFRVVPEFQGRAISVGRKLPGIDRHFKTPEEVRLWLGRLAMGTDAFALLEQR